MIVLLSTSDTDLLSARASGAGYRLGNPARLDAAAVPALLDGADVVVVRILGGRRAWEDGLDAVLASGVPAVVLGGEQAPDAELMELSTVSTGIVAEAHAYLAHGGQENLRQLARFLSDAITADRRGLRPAGPHARLGSARPPGRPGARGWAWTAPGHRHPVLPRPSRGGEHRLRARARRRRHGGGRPAAPGVLLVAADRRAGPDRHAARRGRGRRDRPRGRAASSPRPPARAVPTRNGTWARSPAWTCRSCRACA